jgi:hypothetical protein
VGLHTCSGTNITFSLYQSLQMETAIDNGYKLYDYTNVSANTKFMVVVRGKQKKRQNKNSVYRHVVSTPKWWCICRERADESG